MGDSTRVYVLDPGGIPIEEPDFEEWLSWMDGQGRRLKLAHCLINGMIEVSTIYLGVDRSGSSPPLLWETRVLRGRHNGETRRYASEPEAIAGHVEIASRVMCDEHQCETERLK